MLGWEVTVHRGGDIKDPKEVPAVEGGTHIHLGFFDGDLPERLLRPDGAWTEEEVIRQGDYPSLYRLPAGQLGRLVDAVEAEPRMSDAQREWQRQAVKQFRELHIPDDEIVIVEIWDQS